MFQLSCSSAKAENQICSKHELDANVLQPTTSPMLKTITLLKLPCCEHSECKRMRTGCRAKSYINLGSCTVSNKTQNQQACLGQLKSSRKGTCYFANFTVYVMYAAQTQKMHHRHVSPVKHAKTSCSAEQNMEEFFFYLPFFFDIQVLGFDPQGGEGSFGKVQLS